MYVQWTEEKLSLATIAVDLVQQHRATIDLDIGALLAELKVKSPTSSTCDSIFPVLRCSDGIGMHVNVPCKKHSLYIPQVLSVALWLG